MKQPLPAGKTHILKCWPEYYWAMTTGYKDFDVRKGNDRTYLVGDYLDLREWDPKTEEYTRRTALRQIGYIMHGGPWLPDDVWVLGLVKLTFECAE